MQEIYRGCPQRIRFCDCCCPLLCTSTCRKSVTKAICYVKYINIFFALNHRYWIDLDRQRTILTRFQKYPQDKHQRNMKHNRVILYLESCIWIYRQQLIGIHDDVIKWKKNPRYWPFMWGIHRSPVARSFDVFFDLRLNKRLSKQSRRRLFETPSSSLWRHSIDVPVPLCPKYTGMLHLKIGLCWSLETLS